MVPPCVCHEARPFEFWSRFPTPPPPKSNVHNAHTSAYTHGTDDLEEGKGGGYPQGCIRGEGGGWDPPPPPPRAPLWPPPKAGRKFSSVNPLGAEAKLRLSASHIGRGGGGGGLPPLLLRGTAALIQPWGPPTLGAPGWGHNGSGLLHRN